MSKYNSHGNGPIDANEIEYLKEIREFGSFAAREAIDAFIEHGNAEDAAKAIGVQRSEIRRRIQRLRRSVIRRGFAPAHDMTEMTPEGYGVKGVSTYYGINEETGEKIPKGQWVKTDRDKEERLQLLMDAIMPLAEDVKDKSTFIPQPKISDEDLLCVYPLGDPHIGMHAWAVETGDRNFNLKLAERNLLAAVNHLVDLAPPAKTALLLNLGDFFHADNGKNTTTYGTPVEVDGRFPKVLETGVNLMVETIHAALRKHEQVKVFCLIGNHDDLMSVVLAVCIKHHFGNNPRVEVETAPKQHHYMEFGRCLLGMHHGHATKQNDLPAFMAVDKPVAWGHALFRKWYCGHVHHDSLKEYPGCTVETFRTLAASDAWHAGRYRSGNDMKVDVWHNRWGHINRHIIGIEAVLEQVGMEDD